MNFRYFLPLLCIAAGLFGQETYRCRFTVVTVGKDFESFRYDSGSEEGLSEISVYPSRVSPSYEYQGSDTIRFLAKDAESSESPALASFRFNTSIREWILIFLGTDEGKYRVIGYPMPNIGTTGGETCSFFNVSQLAVAGVMGNHKFSVESGKMYTVDMSEFLSRENSPRIMLALRDRESWVKFYTSFWSVRKNLRYLVLICPDPEASRLNVVRIREVLDSRSS